MWSINILKVVAGIFLATILVFGVVRWLGTGDSDGVVSLSTSLSLSKTTARRNAKGLQAVDSNSRKHAPPVEPWVLPEMNGVMNVGELMHPDDTIIYWDQADIINYGARMHPDDLIVYPRGGEVSNTGEYMHPDDTVMYLQNQDIRNTGELMHPAAPVVYSDMAEVRNFGERMHPDQP